MHVPRLHWRDFTEERKKNSSCDSADISFSPNALVMSRGEMAVTKTYGSEAVFEQVSFEGRCEGRIRAAECLRQTIRNRRAG